eukprot:6233660-Lingulodinium_polyedra.AAC.1
MVTAHAEEANEGGARLGQGGAYEFAIVVALQEPSESEESAPVAVNVAAGRSRERRRRKGLGPLRRR